MFVSCSETAWVLNLQGQDIPYSPLFHAYLYVGLEQAVVFLNGSKVDDSVAGYLQDVGVKRRDYNDVWIFLRKREWGEGKVNVDMYSKGDTPSLTRREIDITLTALFLCHCTDNYSFMLHHCAIIC